MGVFRVELDGLAVGVDGVLKLPLVAQGDAERVEGAVGAGAFWADFQGLSAVLDRLVVFPLTRQVSGEVRVGIGVFRVEVDGLLVSGDGVVQLLLIVQGQAEDVVGVGEFRVEFDSLSGGGDGLGQLFRVTQLDQRGREIAKKIRRPSGRA
jgi:hypothetical protein